MLPNIVLILCSFFAIILALLGTKQIPQSFVYVVERMGKYDRTLKAGLHFILPIFDRIAHKQDVRERQHPELIEVITKDNVQLRMHATAYFRIIDAAKSVYRIQDLDLAIKNAVMGTVRATCGQMEFDEIQGRREHINERMQTALRATCEVWGVEITRAEILDVEVDNATKDAMDMQLNAERRRRASVLEAEGDRTKTMLEADAEFYRAQKEAEGRKVSADAEAYATSTVALAIANNGQSAIDFEIAKLQVMGLTEIAKSTGSKLIIIPTDISKSLGGFAAMVESFKSMK